MITYKAIQTLEKTQEAQAREITRVAAALRDTHGPWVHIRSGMTGELVEAALRAEGEIVHDPRLPNQYWFGYKEKRRK